MKTLWNKHPGQIVIVFLFLVWSTLAYSGIASPLFMARPDEVAKEMVVMTLGMKDWNSEAYYTSTVWPHVWSTLKKTAISLIFSLAIGIALGFWMGTHQTVYRAIGPLINWLRSYPVIALFTLFMLIFGIGDEARIAMITFGTFPIITIGTIEGILNVSKEITEAGQLDGANGFELVGFVSGYLALPYIYSSIKIALSTALVLSVVTEMFIGGRLGLGSLIMDSYWMFDVPRTYGALIILGLIGLAINKILESLRPKLFPWL